MKWMKKGVWMLLCGMICIAPSYAATGNQAYAVYRDGVLFNLTWHAGLMVAPNTSNYGDAIAQATGNGETTEIVGYSRFLAGNSFMGTYQPKQNMTEHEKDLVVATARTVAGRRIPYCLPSLMVASVATSKFYPQDIEKIRCEGVVEYCYEYNGIRVYGGEYWDISRNRSEEIRQHSWELFTPETQAKQYMRKISNAKP